MTEKLTYKYLPSWMVESLSGISLSVRNSMHGMMQGAHSSPQFGSSVEFAEFREYMPGDPIERIDWPVYARTDRYVIRQFHDEVKLNAMVLLDISESMNFKQRGERTKLEHACYLAAAVIYTMINQGDAAGLVTFDDQIRDFFQPANGFVEFRPILQNLEQIKPVRRKGRIDRVLHDMCERIKERTLIVLISDCMQPLDEIFGGVRHLLHDGKEVTVFHVLDEGEMSLPQKGLCALTELESGDHMVLDLSDIRDAYADQINHYLDALRHGCTGMHAEYLLSTTSTEIHQTLRDRSRAI